MPKKVIILGGGVAGMTAAHELIMRGFDVEVYEKQPKYVGGKARSVDVYQTDSPDKEAFQDIADTGQAPLGGEHGFRFFPGFYQHLDDTMRQIPTPDGKTVIDNLVQVDRVLITRFGEHPIKTIVNFPKNLRDIITLVHSAFTADIGFTKEDIKQIENILHQLLTSSYTRRIEEYEPISWVQFSKADQMSEAYRKYFAEVTHTLVAAQADKISAKTAGNILLQLLLLMANPSAQADRVLNQPTNQAWLFIWRDFLESKGVKYFHHHQVTDFQFVNGEITGVEVNDLGEKRIVTGDYYISAMPVERLAQVVTEEMKKYESRLATLSELANYTDWMTGIQYYLNQTANLVHGHVIHIDAPWALTSISQIQFWENYHVQERGKGNIREILSVDVSNWDTKGILFDKTAKECTKDEIRQEVWAQIKQSVNVDGKTVLHDDMIEAWYLDRDIEQNEQGEFVNAEPLLVNVAGTWNIRPEAYTQISNFFLSGDYVRTHTDLATMEGANEAAKRAVNAILQQEGANKKTYCSIHNLHEPNFLLPYRWYDNYRYKKGLAWSPKVPKWVEIASWMVGTFNILGTIFKKWRV